MDAPFCSTCMTPLETEDGHLACLSCLDVDHIRAALTEHACMQAAVLPLADCEHRFTDHVVNDDSMLPPSGMPVSNHPLTRTAPDAAMHPHKKRDKVHFNSVLSKLLDALYTAIICIDALLLQLQPQHAYTKSITPSADVTLPVFSPNEEIIDDANFHCSH